MNEVKAEAVHAVMDEARECAMQMSQNALFIQGELPNVEMPDELLGAQGSETDVRSRVNRIIAWMGLDIATVHELVFALHSASKEDPDYAVAFMLGAESGANILKAFGAVAAAADEFRAQA